MYQKLTSPVSIPILSVVTEYMILATTGFISGINTMDDYDDLAVQVIVSLMADGHDDDDIEIILSRALERLEDPTEFFIIDEEYIH